MFKDIRFALRTLAANPGFTAVAIIALSLGIGVNAIMFTITNAVLFKGMPFDKHDRVLYLATRNPKHAEWIIGLSYPDYLDWSAAKSLHGVAAWSGTSANLSDNTGLPEQYQGSRITSNSFGLTGQKPILGRDFMPADAAPGAPPVAILTYGLWDRRYGKDPSILGKTARINAIPTTWIGVMPQNLQFPANGDLFLPMVPEGNFLKREWRGLIAFGWMADGATLASTRSEVEGIAHNLSVAYPATNQEVVPRVLTYNEFFNGSQNTTLFLAMLGAVGFVLLIACANVANLLLARAVARSREISIRVALGAARWHIVRQLLIEALMLSIAAGIIGYLLSLWGMRIFESEVRRYIPSGWRDFSMDAKVFLYLILISLATGVLFGLAPALRLARLDVNSVLKDGSRGATGGGRGKYLSGLLVVAEMGLAVVLLTGAGLMIRSFVKVYRAPLGVDTSHVLTMRLFLPDAKYPHDPDEVAFHERLIPRLQAIAGVDSVAIATTLPTGGSREFPYELDGVPPPDPRRRPTVSSVIIGPDYFRVMTVPCLAGRVFNDADGVAGPAVVIVNQRFASKTWPNEDPLGKRLRIFDANAAGPWLSVIGVVPNIVQNDISPREIDPLIYLPYREKVARDVAIVAKTQLPPGNLTQAFRRAVQNVDSDMPVYNLWTMDQRLERNYFFIRIIGVLFAIFAGIALLLASLGLYAVIAHSVNQRTQEIGIRMALGASAGDVSRLVFAHGMLQVAIGLALGLAGAIGLTRLLKSILVQVSPNDPGTFAAVAAILAFAAFLGCALPARRATRVDPLIALRHD